MSACDKAREGAEVVEVSRYQPVMVLTDKRLECDCGALAIYMLLSFSEEQEQCATAFYCQSCYEREQEQEE